SACWNGCSSRRVSPAWRACISSCARATTPRAASTARWASTRRYWCRATTAASRADARKARCACCACCAFQVRCPTPGARRAAALLRNNRQSEAQLRGVPLVVVAQRFPVAVEVLHVEIAAHHADLQVARAARDVELEAALARGADPREPGDDPVVAGIPASAP